MPDSGCDVCDASPYLQRAAREWGLRTERVCPVCRREPVWEIAGVYGEALGRLYHDKFGLRVACLRI